MDRYQAALTLLNQERQPFWQTFAGFLLAHTVFLAFLLQSLAPGSMRAWRPATCGAGILGLVLCVPWLLAHLRTTAYLRFRVAQVREAEPTEWQLVAGRGQRFAEGEAVSVDGSRNQMPCLARLGTTYFVTALVLLFALTYASIVFAAAPWWRAN